MESATLRCLAPTPDFDAVEHAFHRIDAIRRRAGERNAISHWILIEELVHQSNQPDAPTTSELTGLNRYDRIMLQTNAWKQHLRSRINP